MIHLGSDHKCVMSTFVINAQKRMAPATHILTSREGLQRKIPVHRSLKDGNKGASMFEERYKEPEEKIKLKVAAAKSELKQIEDEKNHTHDGS